MKYPLVCRKVIESYPQEQKWMSTQCMACIMGMTAGIMGMAGISHITWPVYTMQGCRCCTWPTVCSIMHMHPGAGQAGDLISQTQHSL